LKLYYLFLLPFLPDIAEGWTDLLLDHGTYYIDNSTSPAKKIHFKDKSGNLVTGNLDGQGGQLAADIPPNILRRNSKLTADFNELDLGPYV